MTSTIMMYDTVTSALMMCTTIISTLINDICHCDICVNDIYLCDVYYNAVCHCDVYYNDMCHVLSAGDRVSGPAPACTRAGGVGQLLHPPRLRRGALIHCSLKAKGEWHSHGGWHNRSWWHCRCGWLNHSLALNQTRDRSLFLLYKLE